MVRAEKSDYSLVVNNESNDQSTHQDDDQLIIHSNDHPINQINDESNDPSEHHLIDRSNDPSEHHLIDRSNDDLIEQLEDKSINQSIKRINKLIYSIYLIVILIILFLFIHSIYPSINQFIKQNQFDHQINKSIDQVVNQPNTQSYSQTIHSSINKVFQSLYDSVNESINRSFGQSVSDQKVQSLNQTITESIKQKMNQMDQLVDSTINESIKQILTEAEAEAAKVAAAKAAAAPAPAGVGVAGVAVQETDNYLRVYNLWKDYCEDNNIVLNRGDQHFGRLQNDSSAKRIWTMNNLTNSLLDYRNNKKLPKCSTPQSVLDSVKYGERIPVFGQPLTDTELHRSIFSPSQCAIEWMSSDDMCSVLNQFSHVVLVGDSIHRHFIESVYAALTEDWRMGGLAPFSKAQLYDNCQCDGVYSEHAICRDFAAGNIYFVQDLRSRGVCYNAIPPHNKSVMITYTQNMGHRLKDLTNWDWLNYLCNPDDDRPRVFYLEGFWHYGSDVDTVKVNLIDPYFNQLTELSKNCSKPFKIHFVYTPGHSQSRWLDERYPHQKREVVAVKGTELDLYAQTRWNSAYLDFWNLTRDAPSSDGLHHLTDSNLVKVQYFVNYLQALDVKHAKQ